MNGRTNAKNGGGAIRDGCAVLEIRCLADSVITAIRADGLKKIQKKGYIDLNDTNYWFYYIIIAKTELSSSIWTITATSGTDIMTTTAVIDSSKQYIITFRLPNIYQEVEYITSSGTQYITTDIRPKDITKFNIAFMFTSTPSDGGFIFGTRYRTTYDQDFYLGRSGGTYAVAIKFGQYTKDNFSLTANSMYNVELDIVAKKLIWNGTVYDFSTTVTQYNPLKIMLFAWNNSGAAGAFVKTKLYSLSFYNENGIIEEFIPCYRISDSVVGLWGRYAQKFYTNNGTGVFTAGPDVVE